MAHITSAPEFTVRRHTSVWTVVLAEILIVAAVLIAWSVSAPWWIGAIVGIVLAVPLFLARNGFGFTRSLRDSMALRLNRRHRRNLQIEPVFDVPLPDGGTFGMRWDGETLVTMMRIEPRPRALTFVRPGAIDTDQVVPLDAVADCLEQFDITLDSIDVVSSGARVSGYGDVARTYEQVLGPLPATAFRTVWIILRLNPLAVPEAVGRRGGGPTGALRSAIIATRRVANRLGEFGHRVSVLSAAEVTSAMSMLNAGSRPDEMEESLSELTTPGRVVLTSFELNGTDLTSEALSDLWTVPSLSTTLAIRLRRNGSPEKPLSLRTIVRYSTAGSFAQPPLRTLNSLNGQQFSALAASLPIGRHGLSEVGVEYDCTAMSLRGLSIPAAGCGQLIGADQHGRAITLPLVGAQVRDVVIVGTLHLAQQVILRAIALGATVLVHTRRPQAWGPMAGTIGDPRILQIASGGAGQQQAGARRGYTVLICDGVNTDPHTADMTVIRLLPPEAPLHDTPEVVLTQNVRSPQMVHIQTEDGVADAVMVATEPELRYIGASLPRRRTEARHAQAGSRH